MNFLVAKKVGEKGLIHINLDNIGYFKIEEESDKGMILAIVYRKKATEKLIEIKTSHDKEGFRKFLFPHKIFLLEKYFINVKSIDFVDEEFIDNKHIKLHFYFKDGQNITIKTTRARWNDWSNLRLK